MESSWLVLVSLALGLMVGAGFISLLQIAERHGRRASEVVNPAVPDGIDQVLDALDTAAVVLDPSNNVMKTSPAAVSMGMVWNRQIVHPELLELAAKVRRSGEPIARPDPLPRPVR